MSGTPRTSDRPRAPAVLGPRGATPAMLSYHDDCSEDTLVSAITRTCTCSSCTQTSEDIEARHDEDRSRVGPSRPRSRSPSERFDRRDSISERIPYWSGDTTGSTRTSRDGRGEAAPASSTFLRRRDSDDEVPEPVYYEPPNVRDARFEADILRQIGFVTSRRRPRIVQEAGRHSFSAASLDFVAERPHARARSLRARLRGIIRRASGIGDIIALQRNHGEKGEAYDEEDVNDDLRGPWHPDIDRGGDDATDETDVRRAGWADGSSCDQPRAATANILSLSRRACTAGRNTIRTALNASRRYYFVEGHPHGVSDQQDDRKVNLDSGHRYRRHGET